ncbi:MAG TPA: DUF3108 domain-containing protein, partial [Stellaceae bacterium]|nr:DUF3108 domain-containing protein [Stellaceae bacterium]
AGAGLGMGLGGTGVDAGAGVGIGVGDGTGSGSSGGGSTGGSGSGGGTTAGGGTGSGTGGTGSGTGGTGTGVGGGTTGAGGSGIAGGGGEGVDSGSSSGDLASAESGAPSVPELAAVQLSSISPAATNVPPLHEWRYYQSTLSSLQPFRFNQGAVVFLSTGGFIKYAEVEGKSLTTVNAAGSVVMRPGGFFTPQSGSTYDESKLTSLWPLKVGKTVQFVQHRDNNEWRQTIKVLGTETIDTPAGRFDTFVVQRDARGLGNTNFAATYTYWYAPSPGAIVKFDVHQKAGAAVAEKPWVAARVLTAEATHASN